jgi:outer membrane protein assembly factor BamB
MRIMHCSWSSPTYGAVGNQGLVFYGGPDGYCYAFNPVPMMNDEGVSELKEIWRFDCNLPEYRAKDGVPIKYAEPEGPSEIISTPVYYKDRVYVAIGQDPEHGTGLGNFSCIDAGKSGDISETGKIWSYSKIDRTISTPSITDGLVYIADYAGRVHCLDADSGTVYWVFDTLSHIWGSTLVADGKVYIGNEDGILTILKAGRDLSVISKIDMGAPIYGTPIAANGVLYVQTQTHLYAID